MNNPTLSLRYPIPAVAHLNGFPDKYSFWLAGGVEYRIPHQCKIIIEHGFVSIKEESKELNIVSISATFDKPVEITAGERGCSVLVINLGIVL